MTFDPLYPASYAEINAEEFRRQQQADQPYEASVNANNTYRQFFANNRAGQDLAALAKAFDPKGPLALHFAQETLRKRGEEQADIDDEARRRRAAGELLPSEEAKLESNDKAEEELKEDDAANTALATKVYHNTGDYDIAERLRGRSQSGQAYIAKDYFNQLINQWNETLPERLANDDRRFVLNGKEYAINQKGVDSVVKAAQIGILSKEFVAEHKLNSTFDEMFLHKYFYKKMDAAEAKFMGSWKAARAVNRGITRRETIYGNMWQDARDGNDINLSDIINGVMGTPDKNGSPLNRQGAWSNLKAELKRVAEVAPGDLDKLISLIEKSPDPQHKGETVGKARPYWIEELKELKDKETINEINEHKDKLKADSDEYVNGIVQEVRDMAENNTPVTESFLVEKQREHMQKFGTKSDRIDDLLSKHEMQKQDALKQLKELAIRQPNHKLAPYQYQGYPADVLVEARKAGILMSQDEAAKHNTYTKQAVKLINGWTIDAIKASHGSQRTTEPLGILGNDRALADYNSIMSANIDTLGEEKAHSYAITQVQEKFKLDPLGKIDPTDPVNGSEYFKPIEPITGQDINAAKQSLVRVKQNIADNGKPTLDILSNSDKVAISNGETPLVLEQISRQMKIPQSIVVKRYFSEIGPNWKPTPAEEAIANDPIFSGLKEAAFGYHFDADEAKAILNDIDSKYYKINISPMPSDLESESDLESNIEVPEGYYTFNPVPKEEVKTK